MDYGTKDYGIGKIFLANNIRNLRKRNNWSQEELAAKVGLNRGNIASYEKGTAEPKICNLLKLSRCLGVPILELIGKDLSRESLDGIGTPSAIVPSLPKEEEDRIHSYIQHFRELETVVESLYNCHCFALKQISEEVPELKTITSHFQQMHSVTNSLMNNHRQMLTFLEKQFLSASDPGG